MKHIEAEIQTAIIQYLDMLGIFSFAVPNDGAGRTSIQRAMRLKRMGLRPGIADIVIVEDDGTIGFLEVKTQTGRLTDNQHYFSEKCKQKNWHYAIVRSIDDVERVLKDWRLLPGK